MQPPPHVALIFVGAALGVKWDKLRESMTAAEGPVELPVGSGPSIAELSQGITPPKALGSTLAASIEALRRLVPPDGQLMS